MANRCKNCGRKIVWLVSTHPDLWSDEWVHKKTNGRHCPYTDNMIDPYVLEVPVQ